MTLPFQRRKDFDKSGLKQLEDILSNQVLELYEKLQLAQRKSVALRNLALKHQVNVLRGEEKGRGVIVKPFGLPQCDAETCEGLSKELQAAAKVSGIHFTRVDSNVTVSDDDVNEVWDIEGELRSHTFKITFSTEGKELMDERTKAEKMMEEDVPDLVIQKGTEPMHFSYLPSADCVIDFDWDFVWDRMHSYRHDIRITCSEEVKQRFSRNNEISSVLSQESLDSPTDLMEFFNMFD